MELWGEFMLQDILRKIPSVDRVINEPDISDYVCTLGRERVTRIVRKVLDDLKAEIVKGNINEVNRKVTMEYVVDSLKTEASLRTKRVINATGVVLHTNLGRAVLSSGCMDRLKESTQGYCDLEYELDEGKRGSRYRNVEKMLTEITGCEAAAVVNNNAAAVLLLLSSLAKGKEVVISRGELVEIGGSFRVPDVMAESGAILREVGTTNKTRSQDYENAIDKDITAMVLKVHASNFKIIGFTQTPTIRELSVVARFNGIPLSVDLGSGLIYDITPYGLPYEPFVIECLREGADIVTFSGDKLLGGPQAGIILGKKQYIDRIKKNPLIRALRIDKLNLICLEETLSHYYSMDDAVSNVPTLKMLTSGQDVLRERAEKILNAIADIEGIDIEISEDFSEAGGGSMPGVSIMTTVLRIKHHHKNATEISRELRLCEVPIVCRVAEDALIMDMRTISDNDIGDISRMFYSVLGDD